jgi:DHA1 family bicyclomycin/chloramphenicol resistance-like MFS transporter
VTVVPLRLVVLLSAIFALQPLVTDGFLPAIGPMMSEFGIAIGGAQLATSAAFAGFAIAQLLVGALADRFGRRPVLLAAIVLLLAASAGAGLATSFRMLIGFRFLQGVAAAAGPVLSRAIVRDLCSRVEGARILSFVALGLSAVPLAIPAINAFVVARFGWRAALATYVVYLVAVLAMTARWYRETLVARDPQALAPRELGVAAVAILRNRPALGYLLCCVFGYATLATWIAAAPHLLAGFFAVPPTRFGMYWGIPVLTYAAGSFASARGLRRFSSDTILTTGAGLMLLGAAAGIATLAFQPRALTGFMAAIGVCNFGWAILQPHALAGVLASQPERAGRVSALLGFVQMLGGGGIGLVFSQLHDGTPSAAIGLIALMALVVTAARHLLIARHAPLSAA